MTAEQVNAIRDAIMTVKSLFPQDEPLCAFAVNDVKTYKLLCEAWESLTAASVTLASIDCEPVTGNLYNPSDI